ncbi:MAG: GNAT family N-acetyltransferase [Acidobacteriota bacterium]|nr:GNAT family N-acetyltransferase [Acidobacteriota bacterium]
MTVSGDEVRVVNTQPKHFSQIIELCRVTYPDTAPWTPEQLASHRKVFPDGQFVALQGADEHVVGMCASLVVSWEDYKMLDSWERFTADGAFTNHDPKGRTLYGAEVMVDPRVQHHGVGDKLYAARRDVAEGLGLLRIRAGARLRDYHRYAATHQPADYVILVVEGQLHDPTLSFQLREGFHVVAVVPHYLSDDPESMGYAAVIEWLNPLLVKAEHVKGRPTAFLRHELKAEASSAS